MKRLCYTMKTIRGVLIVHRQSSYWAGKNGNKLVQDDGVKRAVAEQIYRSNQLEKYIQEMIDDGTILIDTEGGDRVIDRYRVRRAECTGRISR